MADIRSRIVTAVIRPIFDGVCSKDNCDQSLPKIVFDNRRERARTRILDALVSRGAPVISEEMRAQVESMVGSWRARSFDDGFQPIQEFEIRCARDRELVMAQESGDARQVLAVLESEYRRKVAGRFGSIELR